MTANKMFVLLVVVCIVCLSAICDSAPVAPAQGKAVSSARAVSAARPASVVSTARPASVVSAARPASAVSACRCTRQYSAVCANDGRTYSNKCMLNCTRDLGTSKMGKGLFMVRTGPC